MAHNPIFDQADLGNAGAYIDKWSKLPINKAIRLHHALQAFFRNVDDNLQSVSPIVKIMAVDTSEIGAATEYGQPHFSAFTFGNLLVASDDSKEQHIARQSKADLFTLDLSILQHLLHQRSDRFVLLDPHADEVRALRESAARRADLNFGNIEMSGFNGYTAERLSSIESYLTSQKPTLEMQQEWEAFRNTFLPHWRHDLRDEIWEASQSFRSIDAFVKKGNYLFLRPETFGERSVMRSLKERLGYNLFDWADFEKFAIEGNDDIDVQAEFREICRIIPPLMDKFGRHKNQQLLNAASVRDAHAIATIHTLNSYFKLRGIKARIELISRSPSLHDLMAALPGGRLHVTIRHPFLIPDIYAFDAQALASLGTTLNRLHGILEPFVISTENGADNEDDSEKRMAAAKKVAQDLVPLLRDVQVSQQSVEQSESTLINIYNRIIDQPFVTDDKQKNSRSGETDKSLLVEKIKSIFKIISVKLRQQDDPFSRTANQSVYDGNLTLLDYEVNRSFQENDQIDFRVLDFRVPVAGKPEQRRWNNSFGNQACMALRTVNPTGPTSSRLFLIHSTRAFNFLVGNGFKPAANFDGSKPTTVRLRASSIWEEVNKALTETKAAPESEKLDITDYVRNLDFVLIACLAFASKRRFDTAISLASSLLHPIIAKIRNPGKDELLAASNVRLSLAFRELFLLRHYCERAVAMEEYFGDRTSAHVVERNFARAQRDIDFAALMSENAEAILLSQSEQQVSTDEKAGKHDESMIAPAGALNFRDYRLRLAHLGGWTDQFLIAVVGTISAPPLVVDWKDSERERLRQRFSIWNAAGLVKETVSDAFECRAKRSFIEGTSQYDFFESRYLAYMEARALQGALTIFLIFLSFRISPDIQKYWVLDGAPLLDKVLVFRDWESWWNRFQKLAKDFEFLIRAVPLMSPVFKALQKIEELRTNRTNLANQASYEAALANLLEVVNKIAAPKRTSREASKAPPPGSSSSPFSSSPDGSQALHIPQPNFESDSKPMGFVSKIAEGLSVILKEISPAQTLEKSAPARSSSGSTVRDPPRSRR